MLHCYKFKVLVRNAPLDKFMFKFKIYNYWINNSRKYICICCYKTIFIHKIFDERDIDLPIEIVKIRQHLVKYLPYVKKNKDNETNYFGSTIRCYFNSKEIILLDTVEPYSIGFTNIIHIGIDQFNILIKVLDDVITYLNPYLLSVGIKDVMEFV